MKPKDREISKVTKNRSQAKKGHDTQILHALKRYFNKNYDKYGLDL